MCYEQESYNLGCLVALLQSVCKMPVNPWFTHVCKAFMCSWAQEMWIPTIIFPSVEWLLCKTPATTITDQICPPAKNSWCNGMQWLQHLGKWVSQYSTLTCCRFTHSLKPTCQTRQKKVHQNKLMTDNAQAVITLVLSSSEHAHITDHGKPIHETNIYFLSSSKEHL